MSLEALKKEVVKKLAEVEHSVTTVEQQRTSLQENSSKLRCGIHEAVEHLVESLRVREKHLVRQVEVVTAHQSSILGIQLAGFVHSKGALSSTHSLLQRCSPSDSATLDKVQIEDLSSLLPVHPLNLVTLELDETPVTEAISSFGSIGLPDTITHHTSSVIPSRLEEYDDSDHDVMHKSLSMTGGQGSQDAEVKIHFHLPRLPKQSWLSPSSNTLSRLNQMELANKLPKGKPTSDVFLWLNHLKVAEEDGGVLEADSFVNVESGSSSVSSSIEIVPSILGDSDKDDCSHHGSEILELENLHLHVEDKSRWLSTSSCSSVKEVSVPSACHANETCASFAECVFSPPCQEVAVEKVKQSSDWNTRRGCKRALSVEEGTNIIISHMIDIQKSDNARWLLPSAMSKDEFYSNPRHQIYKAPPGKWVVLSPADSAQGTDVPLAKSTLRFIQKLKHEKEQRDNEKMDEEKESQLAKKLTDSLNQLAISPTKNWLYSISGGTCGRTYTVAERQSNMKQSFRPWLMTCSDKENLQDNRLTDSQPSKKLKWLSSSVQKRIVPSDCIPSASILKDIDINVEDDADRWLLKKL